MILGTRNEEEENRSKRKSSRNTAKLSLLVTNAFEWNWDLERFWFNLFVSCIECTISCIECDGWKLGYLEVLVVGGIYSPNHQSGRWGGCLSKGASDSPVRHRTLRQPRHPTVGFDRWSFWQLGPPDSPVVHRTGPVHCPVRLLAPALTSAHAVALFTVNFCRRPLTQLVVAPLAHRTVWCYTGQSGATPDSPVLHRTVRWIIAEWLLEFPKVASLELFSLVHWTVRCARPGQPSVVFCSFYLNPFLDFLLVCVEPLTPVELIF
jgi:hypothetical protein